MFDQFAAFILFLFLWFLVFYLYSDLGFLLGGFFVGGRGSSFDNLLCCIDLRSSVTVLENL